MPTKDAVRRVMLDVRKAISSAQKRQAAEDLCRHFMSHFNAQHQLSIGSYAAMGHEISSDRINDFLGLQATHSLALPQILPENQAERGMRFVQWSFGGPLFSGAFGTYQPQGEEVVPDLILVPLLAFDHQGNRLGRGGGFYDRYLASARATRALCAVGLAFDEQYVENCPVNSHDEPLDGILTPSGLCVVRKDRLAPVGLA